MTEVEEARLMRRVMDDSMNTHNERQWDGLETALALSAADDVAIPELDVAVKEEVHEEQPLAAWDPRLVGQHWSWSCTTPEMADAMGDVN